MQAAQRRMLADNTILFEDEAATLRWFLLPSEARALLLSPSSPSAPLMPSRNVYPKSPFSPVIYPLSDCELNSRVDYVWEPEEETLRLGAGTRAETAERSEPTANSGGVSTCNRNKEDNISLSRNSHRNLSSHEKEKRNVSIRDGVGSTELRINDESDVKQQIVKNYADKPQMNIRTVFGGKMPAPSVQQGEGMEVRNEGLTVANSEMGNSIEKSDEERPQELALPTLEKDIKLPNGKQTKNSSKKKQKIVCEDLKCFVKRDDGIDCCDGGGDGINNDVCNIKKKWHAPPKNIFNPTIEVRIH